MSFKKVYRSYDWDDIEEELYSKTPDDVVRVLNKTEKRGIDDFMALISPAASAFLEEMAVLSHETTKRRFGNIIQMYIPLYLSNHCGNFCTYCGFSLNNKLERIILNQEQILEEIRVIKSFGFDNILLVTGDSKGEAGQDYFKKVLKLLRPYFSQISMEIQPLDTFEYLELTDLGLNSVMIYQETYGKKYKKYHPKGKKSDLYYRLETPDRLGQAGIHRIGLGCLIGLDDWRVDSWFTALHLDYLKKKYWKTKFSISFPRLRPAMGYSRPEVEISDRELVQLICAYRIFDENIELSLSTREPPEFRDNVFKLGITSMSAGSKTEPGGYALNSDQLEQFRIGDNRSPQTVAEIIKAQGYEPVWKDWDMVFG